MLRRCLTLIVLVSILVATLGCIGGGTPPTLKDQAPKFDAAVQKYDHAKDLYRSDNFTQAKAEFIDALNQFKDNQAAYDTIAKQNNISGLEKKIATDMANDAGQYEYAAAFMRDAAAAAASGNKDNAYAIELNADEFDLVANNNYEANKKTMQEYWSSQK